MVDIGLKEFLGLHLYSRIFIELLCNKAVFGGDCKVAHGEVKQLSENIAGIEESVVVLVIRPIL